MKNIYLLILFLVFISFGCKQTTEPVIPIDETNLILGYWVNPEYDNTGNVVSFTRAEDFNQDYGFKFKSNLEFIERKNAGWCGTPPIAYDNFKGKFNLSDKKVSIKVPYWGGNADYEWEIINIDDKNLTIKKIKENYGK